MPGTRFAATDQQDDFAAEHVLLPDRISQQRFLKGTLYERKLGKALDWRLAC